MTNSPQRHERSSVIDLKAFTDDAVPYFKRLRAKVVPSGVAEYGERGGSAPGFSSKPPMSLTALECADLEAVALWRILAHYGEHKAFNPYMLARKGRVIGIRSGHEDIVHYMADDAAECIEWDDGGRITVQTRSFCDWVRSKTISCVGMLAAEGDWITQDEACELYGLNRKSLWRWRESGDVRFEKRDGTFLYDRCSLADMVVRMRR